ncbi:dihydrodipicolinate synthase family protein [Staphylococcus aureus]
MKKLLVLNIQRQTSSYERIRKAFPDKLILSGFDQTLVQATISGVDGAIGSTYNVNGRRARKIFDLARQGQIQEAYHNMIQTTLSKQCYQWGFIQH